MRHDIVLTCALTGSADSTAKNRHVPITPEQIARAADDAAKAGATIVHIHVRDPATGKESYDCKLFLEVVDRIRQQGTDVIINLTTAIGVAVAFDADDPSRLNAAKTDFWPPARRLQHIELAMPELCSLDMPIMNFNEEPYINLPEHVRFMATRLRELKVKPEIECFDLGDLWATQRLIDEELFETPPLIQLCMGIRYGAPATTRSLVAMHDLLPARCIWGAFGIGDRQMPMAAQSFLMGGHVRVGLEDNLYLSKGVPATNTQLVERAVEIIERLGGRIATTAEARRLLNLPAR